MKKVLSLRSRHEDLWDEDVVVFHFQASMSFISIASNAGSPVEVVTQTRENKTIVEGHAFGYHLVVTPC